MSVAVGSLELAGTTIASAILLPSAFELAELSGRFPAEFLVGTFAGLAVGATLVGMGVYAVNEGGDELDGFAKNRRSRRRKTVSQQTEWTRDDRKFANRTNSKERVKVGGRPPSGRPVIGQRTPREPAAQSAPVVEKPASEDLPDPTRARRLAEVAECVARVIEGDAWTARKRQLKLCSGYIEAGQLVYDPEFD